MDFAKEINYLFSDANLDHYCCETPEEKASQAAARKFKAFLKRQFPDCDITVGKGCYCYCYAFISRNGKYVYVNIGDFRFDKNWSEDVLYREAKHDKDWTGGINNYTSIKGLKEAVYEMLNYLEGK